MNQHEDPTDPKIDGVPLKYVRTRAQAADVPLDAAGADEAAADEEDDEDAVDFESDPVVDDDEDEVESDVFEGDEAGVLLDEEPRLSFR